MSRSSAVMGTLCEPCEPCEPPSGRMATRIHGRGTQMPGVGSGFTIFTRFTSKAKRPSDLASVKLGGVAVSLVASLRRASSFSSDAGSGVKNPGSQSRAFRTSQHIGTAAVVGSHCKSGAV